jgi:regulator of nucleoside diphosphate kinase
VVFPSEADSEQGKISILAPVGTALLGYRVGDTVEWKLPGGLRRLKIERILYQPEAAGDYHL